MERGTTLVWIDLEMTGLDVQRDVILEIASIVTDNNLVVIEEGPSFVIHQPESAFSTMIDKVRTMHTNSKLLDAVRASTVTLEQAQKETMQFLQRHCKPGQAPLCGNSVWQDRNFLQRYMPEIVSLLNYRIIDVTSVKELSIRWHPNDPHATFTKRETHRALQDIRESIAELRHYKKYFFV